MDAQKLYDYAYEQYVYETTRIFHGFGAHPFAMARGLPPTSKRIFSSMHRQEGNCEYVASDLLCESLDRMDADDLCSIHRNYEALLNDMVRLLTIHPFVAHWMVSVLQHIERMQRRQALAGCGMQSFSQ